MAVGAGKNGGLGAGDEAGGGRAGAGEVLGGFGMAHGGAESGEKLGVVAGQQVARLADFLDKRRGEFGGIGARDFGGGHGQFVVLVRGAGEGGAVKVGLADADQNGRGEVSDFCGDAQAGGVLGEPGAVWLGLAGGVGVGNGDGAAIAGFDNQIRADDGRACVGAGGLAQAVGIERGGGFLNPVD